jgi:putative aminopeptidase FrvX
MKRIRAVACFFLLFFCPFLFLFSQVKPFLRILNEVFPVPSPSGYEEKIAKKIHQLLPEGLSFYKENIGSLYLRLGQEKDSLAVVTGMDEFGYFVSGIDPGGYLKLDRAVSSPNPLFDTYHFGRPLVAWTQGGPVSGVLALPSLHLASREMRRDLENLFSLENALVDIGVRSKEEAREKGIAYLDPVTLAAELSYLAEENISGPSLGIKACVALLVSQAAKSVAREDVQAATFVWMSQTKFPYRRSRPRAALGAIRASKAISSSRVLVIDAFPCDRSSGSSPVIGMGPVLVIPQDQASGLGERVAKIAVDQNIPLQRQLSYGSSIMNGFISNERDVIGLFLPVKFPFTPSEVIDLKDVRSLEKLIEGVLK